MKYSKGQDFLNDSFKERMQNYFNPYEYNFESNFKDRPNYDIARKSQSHSARNIIKKGKKD